MALEILERDWKVFRDLHSIALERFCERALAEVASLASESGRSAHERYGAVFKLLHRRDKELAQAFDAMRRSTALLQLAVICSHGLLTREEFARFTPEARDVVEGVLSLRETPVAWASGEGG